MDKAQLTAASRTRRDELFVGEVLAEPGGGCRFRSQHTDLVSLLLARASDQPDAPFLTDGRTGETLSFQETLSRATGLASRLQEQGFGPQDRLVIIEPTSPAAVVAILAALVAHGVAVPVNDRLHPRELLSLISSVRPAAIASSQLAEEVRAAFDGCVVDPTEHFEASDNNEAAVPEPADWALILHTGGTTGSPKSVVLTHDAITQNLAFFRLGLGLTHRDRALVAVPLFHVTGLMAQVLHMLEVGGEAVLLPKFEARSFLEATRSFGITYSCVVPTIMRLLLRELSDTDPGDSLRLLLYGGSSMDPATLERLALRLPGVGLVNTYGATETCGSATFLPAELAQVVPESVGFLSPIVQLSIAPPISEASVPSEREDERFVRDGIAAMTGPSTAAGYLRWEGPAAIVDPFPPGGWWSGDDVGIDDAGLLYVLGRDDDVVNKGGEKIHPEEIERHLLTHASVSEAAVCAVPDAIFGQEMLAAVATVPGLTVTEAELGEHLALYVTRFKVPRYIHTVDELPRTAAGKIDKRRLVSELSPDTERRDRTERGARP